MRDFGKKRWFPKPRTERHWDMLYKAHKTLVPNLQKITLEWSKDGRGKTGIRYFKYYNIKPLQYWNRSLDVKLDKKVEPTPAKLTVELKDGSITELSVEGLTNTEILKKVVSLDPEGAIVTNGPGHLITLE
eukprot:TRINITY_DN10482_c0_g1_i1.p1 TRINITY_DN10482_c0_g1~~TRINITY_DN10482_c0_g1_i1.p1  ORF type:complete len:153 (-),score=26.59 TRINITY_DN10482_c0_g1_i1:70-462(-)